MWPGLLFLHPWLGVLRCGFIQIFSCWTGVGLLLDACWNLEKCWTGVGTVQQRGNKGSNSSNNFVGLGKRGQITHPSNSPTESSCHQYQSELDALELVLQSLVVLSLSSVIHPALMV